MQKSRAIVWRSLADNAGGSEIAETAMILPLLFLLLIGIYWFGQAFRIYGTITNAARDGARAAVNPACATCAAGDPSTNAWNVVKSDLQAAHLDPTHLQPPTTPPTLCACLPNGTTSSCTTAQVSCDTSQANICVQGVSHSGVNNTPTEGLVQLSSTVAGNGLTGGAGECGISVSFQYPFQFWLPFTSLSGQSVNLRAQAQMRAETQ
ncbi:MAG TPA: TadE/TadG family type IV pilus assembly protein [Candidatus Sulfotelmatobacter sp.]|nr:TadE/TadG family type IV pilus assembly protein [Candidatus Sulfotelmatobacter sp.]